MIILVSFFIALLILPIIQTQILWGDVIAQISNLSFFVLLPSIGFIFSALIPVVRSPITSLLCLIATFCATIYLFAALKMEFLAFTFLIVYLGAIAILFLFVIILFNLTEAFERKKVNLVYGFTAYFVFWNVCKAVKPIAVEPSSTSITSIAFIERYLAPDVYVFTNMFYTQFYDLFLASGAVLLIAMFGAIALALSEK